jgi:DNA recombination protein RmuC
VVYLLVLQKKSKYEPLEIENALLKFWQETKIIDKFIDIENKITEKFGEINIHAKEIKELHRSIEQMLAIPQSRGELGEIALEKILEDQLPPNMYGIRKEILKGKKPDAFIYSTVGIICIDSKFPLTNYVKMMETKDDSEKEEFKKAFLNDLKLHLNKVASDYVKPQEGTAEFSFVFIPSEGVYWFILSEAYDLLNDFIKKGVQVVSPLTLSHKIQLIKAGIQSKKLSEKAEKVKNDLRKLSERFKKIDDLWRIVFGNHLQNLYNKASELNDAYKQLKNEFEAITRFEDE